MLKLDTEINIDFVKFFRWWGGQLRALMPLKIRRIFAEGRSLLVVEPSGNKLVICYSALDNAEHLGAFEMNDLGRSQFQELLDKRPQLAHADIVVRLPNSYVVNKLIYVPEAAKANLLQVLGYELDRYSPFRAEQVYYDYMLVGKDAINHQFRLRLFLAPKEKLDVLLNQIATLELKPAYVDYIGAPAVTKEYRARYNLLPEGQRFKKSNRPKVIMFAAIATAVLFFAAVIITPLWMEYQAIEDLQVNAKILEKHALKVNAIKQKIDTLHEETLELIQSKQKEPSLIEVLDVLSALINNDTWLSQYRYTKGKLQIHGHSPTASALIGALEKAPYFKNTRFISPVTQDRKTGLERFQISMDVIVETGHE